MSNVDTSLPPEPSGAAGALAAKHAAEHPLKLYGGWFCPFVQRAWIVLLEKNIDHQYIEINPYNKDPDFLAMNPRGLVPTLGVPAGSGGKEQRPLYESAVLCEYLDEAYDNDGKGVDAGSKEQGGRGRLLQGSPYDRARARIWIDHISKKIVPGFYKILQHTPEKPFSIEEARQEFHENIRTLTKEMKNGGGPWFLGEQFSLVDVMLAPWAKRLWLIDHYKDGGVGVPQAGASGDDEVWARWRAWYNAIVDRPSVKETWSDDERYLIAYKRYADDTTNSLVGQATRQGKAHP